jgi:uncharacterized RDD family membrane protein YckC
MSYSPVAHPDDVLTEGVVTRRVLAWVIDLAIIGVVMSVLFVGFFLFGLVTFGLGMPLISVLPLVPPLYNFLFLLAPPAATPGQMLFGLTTRCDRTGDRPTALQALLSTIGFYVTLATGVIWLAVALISERRRTLHDMLAGLVVVRQDALTPRTGSWNMPRE